MSELPELVRVVQQHSHKIIEDEQEAHSPMLFARDSDGVVHIAGIAEVVDTPYLKEATLSFLRQIDASEYLMVIEVWMTNSRRVLEERIRILDLPPDDRWEVLHVYYIKRGQAPHMYFSKIDNTPHGRRMREWEGGPLESCDKISGRLVIKDW